MEKQYIFFDTSKAFWFSALCGLLMFFAIIYLAAYVRPEFWKLVLFVFAFSGVALLVAFKIDSIKERTKFDK